MSAALSRRVGRASYYPPLTDLTPDETLLLHELSYRLQEFDELPERFQRAVLEAEANRQQAIDGPVGAASAPRGDDTEYPAAAARAKRERQRKPPVLTRP